VRSVSEEAAENLDMVAKRLPQALKRRILPATYGTTEEVAEELNIRRSAPKGALDFQDLRYR
jgi:hypothetical protein